MRIIRNFIDTALHADTELALPEATSNHLLRVLRLGVGDVFHLFNGDGFDYVSEILSAEKRSGKVRIVSRHAVHNESPLAIHVFQSIARGEKMDWIMQKATELGAVAFTPLVAACEQSGRARIPELHEPIAISHIPADSRYTQAYYLQPGSTQRLATLQPDCTKPVHIAIGPEGGFSERDVHLLQNAGFTGLQMGPRILRTETAGLALIAALQAQFGDA